MPALDSCEPPIIRAFQKDGWQIVKKPQIIKLETRTVYADMTLQRTMNGTTENIIVVEVKCFTNPAEDLAEFYSAVGQYLFYRGALSMIDVIQPLFLAFPDAAFERIARERAMIEVINRAEIKYVLVDIEREEIASWNHW